MGSTPQNERNANRFAGKINVPGSPVMLRQWTKPNIVVRTTTDEPCGHGYHAQGKPTPGAEYRKRGAKER